METTVVLIKPDAMDKGEEVVKAIVRRYLAAGLEVKARRAIQFTMETADIFYEAHRRHHAHQGNVRFMQSGPCLALLLAGERAIEKTRELHGHWKDPAPGTIREMFKSAGGPANMVHSSDSPESADREIRLIFESYSIADAEGTYLQHL